MADIGNNFDDGMSDDERAYFSTGGDVTEALARTAGGPLGGEPEPAPTPQPDPSQANGAAAQGHEEQHQRATAEMEDPGDEIVPGQPNPRRVSYRKYAAEQEARRQLEQQMHEGAIARARLEERVNLLAQALQPEPPQPQPDPANERPDPAQDIFAYVGWLENQLNSVSGKVNGYEEQIATGQREMDEERRYVTSLDAYAGRDPNFMQSYNFLLRSRAVELMQDRYPQATIEQLWQAQIPDDIGNTLRQEERSLYKNSFQSGRDPAADIVRMAQSRGWRAPQAAPAAPANGAANGQARPPGVAPNGGGAAPQPRPNGNGATPTATDLVESIRRGQAASTSLSNASGSAAGTALTPEVLANMSDADFTALFNELQASGNKDKLRELFGQ